MLPKPKCPVIALEEHYWDQELAAQFVGGEGVRDADMLKRLYDLGELRLREMDEAGIDMQVISHGAPSAQKLSGADAVELTRRVNDRLHAAVQVNPKRFAAFAALPTSDPKAAADELERTTKLGFKGPMIHGLANGAFLDDKRFWPIYERAEALGLPLGIHVGGYGGHAPTGGGWPSYYCEEHHSNAHTMAAQLASLVIEGIPERFPKLKIVFIEGGFGWIASAIWRMDRHFERFRSEVPHLKRRPSEYVREHFWFTTQPIDEPDEARHLRSLIEWVGVDRLLFSSDYPHWDFDDPRFAFKTPLSETERRKIFSGNARALYRL